MNYLKDSFYYDCTKLFALILIQYQSRSNVSDIIKSHHSFLNNLKSEETKSISDKSASLVSC